MRLVGKEAVNGRRMWLNTISAHLPQLNNRGSPRAVKEGRRRPGRVGRNLSAQFFQAKESPWSWWWDWRRLEPLGHGFGRSTIHTRRHSEHGLAFHAEATRLERIERGAT